jgi:hypothetical protein
MRRDPTPRSLKVNGEHGLFALPSGEDLLLNPGDEYKFNGRSSHPSLTATLGTTSGQCIALTAPNYQ